MEKRTLDILEYGKIVHRLSELSFSELGKEIAENIEPKLDWREIKDLQAETTAGVQFILHKGLPPLRGLYNIVPSIKRSKSGSSMNCQQLLHIASVLRAVKAVHGYAVSDIKMADNIYNQLLKSLMPIDNLEKRLSQAIIGVDELADTASPELAGIRNKIRHAQDKVKQILNKLIKHHASELQEQLITLRGNRYVLPVQDVHRNKINGIVHDTSGSGHTVFVEPMEVIEANNKIRELEAEERDEIAKILLNLTLAVLEEEDNLYLNQELLAKIDFVTAKSRLSLQMQAQPPQLNTNGEIRLINARHPLLPLQTAVPITIKFGGDIHTLLITGPNTGGKTVALKTCGLLTLMAQSGLHIPASEMSNIRIFKDIMVDIGDDQSIEQSLSTFSSHMKQLIRMTAEAEPGILILSDEMGSGTDPLEGAALARAILTTWAERGAVTLATTHYRELKLYALSTPGVENACCELDPDTLQPTYRILMGAVGVSHAFPISENLGLDKEIIERAKSYLTADEKQLEQVMQELTTAKMAAETAVKEAEATRADAIKMRAEAEALTNKLKTQRQEIISAERERAREKYADGLADIDSLMKELREILDAEQLASLERNAGKTRRDLASQYNQIQNEIGAETLAGIHSGDELIDLQINNEYYASTLGITGKLLTLPDGKGQCKLDTGAVQVVVSARTLRAISERQDENKKENLGAKSEFYRQKSRRGRSNSLPTAEPLPLELMLLGETTLDAVGYLDKHIDSAIMHNIHEIRIVHGKGTGALRKAVQQYLQRDKRVKSYRLASYGEGDSGVTIALLK